MSEAALQAEAQYVSVNDIGYELADGCERTFRKQLLRTDRMAIQLTSIRGPGAAEDYGVCDTTQAAYVLSGVAALRNDGREIGKGQLIVIPQGVQWGEQLLLQGAELVLLEVAAANAVRRAAAVSGPVRPVHVVDPEHVAYYEPAGHQKTRNRCLFVDGHMELIEGLIERNGGAARHSHPDNEQVLYLLGDLASPLLIYYPRGAPHGTGGGISEPLHLLVIYSPPLDERNALG